MQKLLLLSLLFPVFTLAQTSKTLKSSVEVYPDSVWEKITSPTEYGWDADKLKQLRGFIIDSAHTTGMLVVQKGKVLFEFGDIQELSYLASCRKSVLSMLYGPFVENGTIKLDRTINQLGLDDIGGLLPVEKRATIKDLLTARSGVYHPASNEGDASSMAPERGSVQPGSFWLYNNWDFNIAGYILEQQTGKNIYDLTDSILAKPLQMQDWKKETQRKTGDTTRSKYLAYHMWFSTRDMARLGYLMLRKGKWKTQQVLPASWVTTTTLPVTTYRESEHNKTAYFHFGYGFLWWVWDTPYNKGIYEGAYTASGAFGQFITIIPKLDLVVAHKTKYDYERQVPTDIYLRILDKLVSAQKR
ncbi:serine hydrolase domain-containing protein [Terrimonas pollutisoli]|uniref:serine hydrolase domain-containing protein n=1 Tax=Terrimonas pollutisoli TaxID=3034147 RepID=UPI0023EC827B|nr:serine hydrolase [Terrimonas sp. H1YJ31]